MRFPIRIPDRFQFGAAGQPGWITDLWQSEEAEWIMDLCQSESSTGEFSQFFKALDCNMRRLHHQRLQSLSINDRETIISRKNSVLAEGFKEHALIDSCDTLSQCLVSAMLEQNVAIDSVCQSGRNFHSWVAARLASADYFTANQSHFTHMCKVRLDSGNNLRRSYQRILHGLELKRKNYIHPCQTNLWPDTLRSIIASRILNISEKESGDKDIKKSPLLDLNHFSPFPPSVLDMHLSTDQIDTIEKLLPRISDSNTRELYRGIRIRPCIVCQKLKFDTHNVDVHHMFRNLTEFPQDDPKYKCTYHKKICSSCRVKWLIRDICQEWWNDLDSDAWLVPRCYYHCSATSAQERILDINEYVEQFENIDLLDLQKPIRIYRQVLRYRHALKELKQRPEPSVLNVAQRVLNHGIDIGLMHNLTQLDNDTEAIEIPQYMTVTIEKNVQTVSHHPIYKVPVFLNLLRRRQAPKECIVCAEDKFEIDYGSWQQLYQACGMYKGPWLWSILEYPSSEQQHCTHPLDVCRRCVAEYITTSLNNGNVEQISCPQCDRALTYHEIRYLCPEETFEVYEKRVLLLTLGKLPNFRWCLSSTCDSGQVYDDVDRAFPYVICKDCKFQMCFYHDLPWHNGSTCDEHDTALKYGDPKYQETQLIIEKNTKKCPHCDVRIEKGSGCFHMTCSRCKHEFCWECLASWQLVIANRLNHHPGCYFRDSNLGPTAITGINIAAALQQRR